MASNNPVTLEAEKLLDNVEDIQEKMDTTPPTTVATRAVDQETPETSVNTSSAGKKLKIKLTKFLEPNFGERCARAMGESGCKLCGFSMKGDLLRTHIRRHFTRFFCKCGRSASTKSVICEHIHSAKREGVTSHMDVSTCFEVDAANFDKLKSEVGLPSEIEFGALLEEQERPAEEKVVVREVGEKKGGSQIVNEPKPSTSTAKIHCQDIRLTMSKEDIANDAKHIREQRKRASKNGKEKANPKKPLTEFQSPDSKMMKLQKETDELRKENTRLRAKYKDARKTLKKVKGHLDKMQQLQHQVSVSQAALDWHLG